MRWWPRSRHQDRTADRSWPTTRPVAKTEARSAAESGPPVPAPAPLGARVRTLVDTVRSLKDPPKTPEEIEAGTAALLPEGTVPADLLHRVLAGHDASAEALTPAQLTTLAELYILPPAYFLGSNAEIENIDAALEFLDLYRNPAAGVPYICGGAQRLTAPRTRAYSAMMRRVIDHQAEDTAGAATTSEGSAEQPAEQSPPASS